MSNRSSEPASSPRPASSSRSASSSETDPAREPVEELPVLAEPAEPLPGVVADAETLERTIDQLRAGSGPLAVDAERAHGFRYSSRAYLLQLRRTGAGTHLIDPIPFTDDSPADFSALSAAMADTEWIIHAATQDLPCLVEVGMVPTKLFDTELAGRLLGLPRVGLGPMIEHFFGVRLLKEHSAADWSTRPLPESWLNYAALDVELLVELRDRLAAELEAAGKAEWAAEEFAWLVEHAADPAPVRVDPWRRTSGIHGVRTPAGMAVVRELWLARDEIAQRLDRSPSKILPDKAISELAMKDRRTRAELRGIPGFNRRQAKRFEANWLAALDRASGLSKSELPPRHLATEGPPPPRTWEKREPEAFARHQRMRAVMDQLSEQHSMPAENLCTPDFWRRLAWQPPEPATEESVNAFLADLGARRWQRELVVPELTGAIIG